MAFDSVYTFLPDRVKLLVGNVYLEGWEKISIEFATEMNKQIVGIRGKNTKVYNKNSAAKVVVTLTQSSDSNTLFQYILDKEQEVDGRIGFIIEVVDLSGGSKFTSMEAYLEGYPKKVEFEGKLSTREWALLCDTSSTSLRGNKDVGGTPLSNLVDTARGLF